MSSCCCDSTAKHSGDGKGTAEKERTLDSAVKFRAKLLIKKLSGGAGDFWGRFLIALGCQVPGGGLWGLLCLQQLSFSSLSRI